MRILAWLLLAEMLMDVYGQMQHAADVLQNSPTYVIASFSALSFLSDVSDKITPKVILR